MSFDLRDYQIETIDKSRKLYSQGTKKILIHLPTGAGKTEIFIKVVKNSIAKGKRCWIMTRGRELCFNAKARLEKRGVVCSMLMGSQHFDETYLANVISIDTWLRRMKNITVKPDLIVIDEAHFAGSPQFKMVAECYPDAYYFCVTATPWQKQSIRHVAEEWIAPTDYKSLVEKGFLLPAKVFVPFTHDLAGVKEQNGDYREDQLMDVVGNGKVYGNIVEHYVKTAGKTKAFCFCVNIRHSKEMVAVFNGQGIRASHLDAGSPREERESVLKRLADGELDVVANCNILSTGVDIPSLRTIISARPTKSRILWVQQAGRGARLHEDKEFFYLMDHANNIKEHGFIDTYQEPMLDGKPKGKKREGAPLTTLSRCEECFHMFPPKMLNCPECGAAKKVPAEKPEDGMLMEVTELSFAKRIVPEHHWPMVYGFVHKAYTRGYKRSYIWVNIKNELDASLAKKYSSRVVIDAITQQIVADRLRQGLEKPCGFSTDDSRQPSKLRGNWFR